MIDGDWNDCAARRQLVRDDAMGLIDHHGAREQYIKWRIGRKSLDGRSLSEFYQIREFGKNQPDSYRFKTHLRPAIASNWHHHDGNGGDWDYVVAWIQDREIWYAIVRDDDLTAPTILRIAQQPNAYTSFAPSVAVGPRLPNGRIQIVVAWKTRTGTIYLNGTDEYLDSFEVLESMEYDVLSTPVVTYMPAEDRYILSFVMSGECQDYQCPDIECNRHSIATIVSTDRYGDEWPTTATHYGSFISSPWQAPAMSCDSRDIYSPTNDFTDECLMMYKQFRTPDTKWINQQGFKMNVTGLTLNAVLTDWETDDSTYANLSLASGDESWIYTFAQDSVGKSTMKYRIKPFWKGVGGDYRAFPTHERNDMKSRVGFPVAYNYRTGLFVFVWHEH